MLLMLIAVVPVFVSVTDFWPPALPIATLYQLRLVGETVPAARQLAALRRAAKKKQERNQEVFPLRLAGEILNLDIQAEEFWQ